MVLLIFALLLLVQLSLLVYQYYRNSNREKKPRINIQIRYKILRTQVKSDSFCYCKFGKAITKWGAMEKSNIAIGIIKI